MLPICQLPCVPTSLTCRSRECHNIRPCTVVRLRRVAKRDCSCQDRVADGSHPPPAPTARRVDCPHDTLQTLMHSTAYCFSRVDGTLRFGHWRG